MSQRAAESVDRILAEHRPRDLPAETRRQLRAIVDRAKASG